MKKQLHKIVIAILGFGLSLFLSSCLDKLDIPEYFYTEPNLEWGVDLVDFTEEMESNGFVLNGKIDEGNTMLFYEGVDIERLISYNFKNNKLVAAAVFIETSLIEYSDVIKTFKGYEETFVGGDAVYVSKLGDVLGVIDYITIEGIEYYAIAWSQMNIPSANAVDLGLSVKWADVNLNIIGFPDNAAPSPEYVGGTTGLYEWGDPTGQAISSSPTLCDISGTEYDIAVQQWGEGWRIPTFEETSELISKCDWQWQQINGRNGYVVTGRNGNSIFIPVTGYENNNRLYETSKGYYWTGTLMRDNFYPYALIFGSGFKGHNISPNGGLAYPMKDQGLAIRPVCDNE